MTEIRVAWWRFAVVCTGVLAVAGLALASPVLLVAGVAPLAYVAYGYTSSPSTPQLSVSRTTDTETPTPGNTVEVTLTVTNEGASAISDLRLVDGVPDPLPVVDGSPRIAAALLPGESTTVSYTLRARRGVYRFAAVRARTRSLPGPHVVTDSYEATGTVRLRCTDVVDSFPLPRQTRQYAGTTTADSGGEGVEFYGSREYRPTDPARRIDWNRVASTGELTTLIHREEQARTTVFLLDASPAAQVGGGDGTYTGTELGAYAIERGGHALLAEDDSVGLGILGTTVEGRSAFIDPGGGETTLDRVRYTLSGVGPFVADALSQRDGSGADEADATSTTESQTEPPPENESSAPEALRTHDAPLESDVEAPPWVTGDSHTEQSSITVDDVLARTASDAQFVLVTPLLTDEMVDTLETLVERQRLVSVLSPNVIRGETLGERLTALDRRGRIEQIERWGIPVVDWGAAEPLQEALIRGAAAVTNTSVDGRQVVAPAASGESTDEEARTDA